MNSNENSGSNSWFAHILSPQEISVALTTRLGDKFKGFAAKPEPEGAIEISAACNGRQESILMLVPNDLHTEFHIVESFSNSAFASGGGDPHNEEFYNEVSDALEHKLYWKERLAEASKPAELNKDASPWSAETLERMFN